MLIVDEFTRHWFVYCIRQKSEVPGILRDFRAMAEKHYSSEVAGFHRLSSLRSDGESVNVGKEVADWCRAEGIVHEQSAPYSQWQDGIVERAIGVLGC